MLDRRLFTNIPWGLVGLVFVIALFGLSAVYSATYTASGPSSLFTKQILWMSAGVIVMFLMLLPDYHTVGRYAYVLYAVSLVLLVLVMVMGRAGMGAQRWLAIGPFAFQPSELAKLSLVLALARFFAEHPKSGGYELRDLAVPGMMIAVPVLFVLKQPDLGTALMLVFTSSLILVLAGIRLRTVLIVLIAGAFVASSLLFISPVRDKVWGSLKPYQQKRILAFIDPGSDPLGSGYHATSRRSWGSVSSRKGFPERHLEPDGLSARAAYGLHLLGRCRGARFSGFRVPACFIYIVPLFEH
jgi:rod shape determining protein RodA